MKKSQENKREYERYNYALKVDLKTSKDSFKCDVVNISRGGILIKSDKLLSIGQNIFINLPSQDLKKVAVVDGIVVRKTGHCFGIRFGSPLESLPKP